MTTINLTKRDLDNGKPTADCCPIALAATRTFDRPSFVYYSFIMGRKKGWLLVQHPTQQAYIRYKLPTAVAV